MGGRATATAQQIDRSVPSPDPSLHDHVREKSQGKGTARQRDQSRRCRVDGYVSNAFVRMISGLAELIARCGLMLGPLP